ncbi:MAG: hypothetical protein A2W00_04400 [Candidatus Eisenbacteria bacterium RBG_16_71_46]|nr:MAG: hypothetical protein A2W00_04400 [Candidatus Eisenbacteria bacterium RBG_16_71_46]
MSATPSPARQGAPAPAARLAPLVQASVRALRVAPPGAWWLVAGLAGGLLYLALSRWPFPVDPAHTICLFRQMTHLDCPGCGLTRSIAELARGHLGAALRIHPLGPLLVAEAALAWAWWGLVLARRVRAPSLGAVNLALLAHAVALLALWGARLATRTLPG